MSIREDLINRLALYISERYDVVLENGREAAEDILLIVSADQPGRAEKVDYHKNESPARDRGNAR